MPEQRQCICGQKYWWPGQRWQHEKCEVISHEVGKVVVNAASNVVVNARGKDRHKKTPERLGYLKKKMREYRARLKVG